MLPMLPMLPPLFALLNSKLKMQRELDIETKLDYPNIFQRQISCFQSYLKADSPKTITVLRWLKSAKYKEKVKLIQN